VSEVSENAGFNIGERLDTILQGYADRQEMARACHLVVKQALEPLLEAWRRQYPKIPPTLEAHLKAQSEYTAINDLARVLNDMASQAKPVEEGRSLLDQALAQAEEEIGAIAEESDVLLE